jgi:hypothetical protein
VLDDSSKALSRSPVSRVRYLIERRFAKTSRCTVEAESAVFQQEATRARDSNYENIPSNQILSVVKRFFVHVHIRYSRLPRRSLIQISMHQCRIPRPNRGSVTVHTTKKLHSPTLLYTLRPPNVHPPSLQMISRARVRSACDVPP